MIHEKHTKYVSSGMIAEKSFVVLPATAHGHLAPPLLRLLNMLADLAGDTRDDVLDEFCACLHRGTAMALLQARL